jgi:hypothetical protein
MASIVELKAGEDPPNAGQWIMVVASDEHDHAERKEHSRGVTIMTSPDGAETSIKVAQAEATREGIATIYVRRMDGAGQA